MVITITSNVDPLSLKPRELGSVLASTEHVGTWGMLFAANPKP